MQFFYSCGHGGSDKYCADTVDTEYGPYDSDPCESDVVISLDCCIHCGCRTTQTLYRQVHGALREVVFCTSCHRGYYINESGAMIRLSAASI